MTPYFIVFLPSDQKRDFIVIIFYWRKKSLTATLTNVSNTLFLHFAMLSNLFRDEELYGGGGDSHDPVDPHHVQHDVTWTKFVGDDIKRKVTTRWNKRILFASLFSHYFLLWVNRIWSVLSKSQNKNNKYIIFDGQNKLPKI